MSSAANPDEAGPFYHGTRAHLAVGSLLQAGFRSNYHPAVKMNHVYFTALVSGAGLAAEVAASLSPTSAQPHVYLVEPTGKWEDDPNVTNQRFPGNITRSYRSTQPLRILSEVEGWERLAPGKLDEWLARVRHLSGEIIN